jgi:uncharacterized protein (UPF0262 family)
MNKGKDVSETSKIATARLEHNKLECFDEPLENPHVEQDCASALSDLACDSYFQPVGDDNGPYDLTMSKKTNKLIIHIKNANGKDLPYLILSLSPYRRVIKDYYLMIQAHHEAVREGRPSKIEAIDMGRRGIHNEGAELLIERLSDKIELDKNTARCLFTLICALHRDKIRITR